MKRRYVLPVVLLSFGALWCFGMMRSPVPFGSRYVGSGAGGTDSYADVVFYELAGDQAVERARAAAEDAGYQVTQADDAGVRLENGHGAIFIKRGRLVAIQRYDSGGAYAQVDENPSSAVIGVEHPRPSWRAWLARAWQSGPEAEIR